MDTFIYIYQGELTKLSKNTVTNAFLKRTKVKELPVGYLTPKDVIAIESGEYKNCKVIVSPTDAIVTTYLEDLNKYAVRQYKFVKERDSYRIFRELRTLATENEADSVAENWWAKASRPYIVTVM